MSTPPRLPGDRGHLARLLDVWGRDTSEPVTSGRLRRLVGVMAIVQMLDGLKDAEGRERLAFKGGRPSSSGSASGPGRRATSTAPTAGR